MSRHGKEPRRYTSRGREVRLDRADNPIETGVVETIRRCGDRENLRTYGVFEVKFFDNSGRRRTKTFSYGRIETYTKRRRFEAMHDAIEFRRRYAQAVINGESFNP